MGLDNNVQCAVRGVLKNPVLSVLRDINIARI